MTFTWFITKVRITYAKHNIVKKHAKLNEDRVLGGAITVKKLCKLYISYGKLPVLALIILSLFSFKYSGSC